MSHVTTRDAKIIQYLNEAYGKERQLETSLEAHISMTSRPPYKKRLQQHLRETKSHARDLERRIRQLGGSAEAVSVPRPVPEVAGEVAARVQDVAQRGAALAQGTIHAVRGTGEQEKLLKNAKTEYWNEHEEIANYTAIEKLADIVGDRDTAQLARRIRREEERMASFLARLIRQLTDAVAREEIPAAERNGGRRRSSRRTSTTSRARSGSARGRARTTVRRGSTARGSARRSTRSTSRGTTRSTARSRSSRASAGSRSTRSRSTGAARSSARRTTRSATRRRTSRSR
jgi:ferritin-like metal-binding protein YciE